MYPSFFVGNEIFRRLCKGIAFVSALFVLTSAQALTGQAGWVKVPGISQTYELFYAPLSIQNEGQRLKRMKTLINYKNNLGEDASLVSETLYNCYGLTKQDQYTLMHSGHWATGEPVNASVVEQEWRTILPKSVGMNVLKVVCR